MLNLETGIYHGLNPVAARMLELLVSTATVREGCRKIAVEFSQPLGQIENDVCAFCGQLEERGLVGLEPAESIPAPSASAAND